MEEKKKRGRPKKEDVMRNVYRIRLDEEQRLILAQHAQKTGESYSQIFRKALLVYDMLLRK